MRKRISDTPSAQRKIQGGMELAEPMSWACNPEWWTAPVLRGRNVGKLGGVGLSMRRGNQPFCARGRAQSEQEFSDTLRESFSNLGSKIRRRDADGCDRVGRAPHFQRMIQTGGSSFNAAMTSAACCSGLTSSQIRATRPFSSMSTVTRNTPIYLRPMNDFSPQTP